jgi:hypothetical protein
MLAAEEPVPASSVCDPAAVPFIRIAQNLRDDGIAMVAQR